MLLPVLGEPVFSRGWPEKAGWLQFLHAPAPMQEAASSRVIPPRAKTGIDPAVRQALPNPSSPTPGIDLIDVADLVSHLIVLSWIGPKRAIVAPASLAASISRME